MNGFQVSTWVFEKSYEKNNGFSIITYDYDNNNITK